MMCLSVICPATLAAISATAAVATRDAQLGDGQRGRGLLRQLFAGERVGERLEALVANFDSGDESGDLLAFVVLLVGVSTASASRLHLHSGRLEDQFAKAVLTKVFLEEFDAGVFI